MKLPQIIRTVEPPLKAFKKKKLFNFCNSVMFPQIMKINKAPPIILLLLDITLCHHVTHLHKLCLGTSLSREELI